MAPPREARPAGLLGEAPRKQAAPRPQRLQGGAPRLGEEHRALSLWEGR